MLTTAALPIAPATGALLTQPLSPSGLLHAGLLTPEACLAIENHLDTTPPAGGVLSNRSYQYWLRLTANAAAYHRAHAPQKRSVDHNLLRQIIGTLRSASVSDEMDGGFEYVAASVAELLSSGVFEQQGNVRPATQEVPHVYRLPPSILNQFIRPWHRALARYVIEQERYETRFQGTKPVDKQAHTLLQLYAWYTALTDDVSTAIHRPLAHGILAKILPRGWQRHPYALASFYVLKLRQMIAIEKAIGCDAPNLTGYIQRGVPHELVREFLTSRAARDRDPRPRKDSTDFEAPLTHIFGRYFYLANFRPGGDDRLLRNMLHGAATHHQLDPTLRAVAYQLFLGLGDYLDANQGRWLISSAAHPRQQGDAFWLTRSETDRRRAIEEAELARSGVLESGAPIRGFIATHSEGLSISDLKTQGLIDERRLAIISYLLHRREPRYGVLSEAAHRFWIGLIANLYVCHTTAFEPGKEVDPGAIQEYALRIIDCDEDSLPSVADMMWYLRELLRYDVPGIEVNLTPTDLPQVGSVRLLPLGAIATPRQLAITQYVLEQDTYESGGQRHAFLTPQLETLVRLYDWYTSLADTDEMDERFVLDRDLVFGIVERLEPEAWERDRLRVGTFYLRKLRQIMAIERGLEHRTRLSGYIERPLPISLIESFVSARHAAYPILPKDRQVIVNTLELIFGRYFCLRRFHNPSAEFPDPRALHRLRRILKTMIANGMMDADDTQAWERLFIELYFFLLGNEWYWTRSDGEADEATFSEGPAAAANETHEGTMAPALRALVSSGAIEGRSARQRRKTGERREKAEKRRNRRQEPVSLADLSRLEGSAYWYAVGDLFVAALLAPAPAAQLPPSLPPQKGGESAAPVPTTTPHTFVVPSWFDPDWITGRGGLANRDTLLEAGLLTRRVADLHHRHLEERVTVDHLLGGIHRLTMNIYCAYRARGGRMDVVDEPLLNRVALDFAQGGRSSADYRAQAKRRAGNVRELIALINEANKREGYDISIPPPVREERTDLIRFSEAVLQAHTEPPQEWATGGSGCFEIETLMRMRRIDPRTVARCRELVRESRMANRGKRHLCTILLCNVVAAYADQHGWTDGTQGVAITTLAQNFVRQAAHAIPNIRLADYEQWAAMVLEWRRQHRGELYPRLETAFLREHLEDTVVAEAERIVAETQGASEVKRERLLRTLLNIFYYYAESAEDLTLVDIPVANAVIAQFAGHGETRQTHEVNTRYRERLGRMRHAAIGERTQKLAQQGTPAMLREVRQLLADPSQTLGIPQVPQDLAESLVALALTEISSDVMIGMLPDPQQHLRDILSVWQKMGLFPPEAESPLFDATLRAYSDLLQREILPAWRSPENTAAPLDEWRAGRMQLNFSSLRGSSLLSDAMLSAIQGRIAVEDIPDEKRRNRVGLFANIVAAYFHRGGSLMIVDEELLFNTAQRFTNTFKIPDPEGYAHFCLHHVMTILNFSRRQLARKNGRGERVVASPGEMTYRPFAGLAGKVRVAEPKPAPVKKENEQETAAAPAPTVPALDPVVSSPSPQPSSSPPGREYEPRPFRSVSDLVASGAVTREIVTACDRLLADQGVGRGPRLLQQHVATNVIAGALEAVGGDPNHVEMSHLAAAFNALAANGTMPSLPSQIDYYLALTSQLLPGEA